MAAAVFVMIVALAAVPVALAAPHVNLLDADDEASEHRAIIIGSNAKSYHGEVKGTDSSAVSWSWAAEPAGLVKISGASSREATVAGVREGTATITVTAVLADGAELSDSMLLTSYTWLPKSYSATVVSGGAVLTRAATGDGGHVAFGDDAVGVVGERHECDGALV